MTISMRFLFQLLSILTVSVLLPARVLAEEAATCPVSLHAEADCSGKINGVCPMGTKIHFLSFADNGARKAYIGFTKCGMTTSFEHGDRGFWCNGITVGRRNTSDQDVDWRTSGDVSRATYLLAHLDAKQRSKYKLPAHKSLRQKWLVPMVDEDGLHKVYPLNYSYYAGYYPRSFTKIGRIHPVANPFFNTEMQSLRYRTLTGEKRSAVAGQAEIDCLKIYFISWQPAEYTPQAEKLMATFLGDMRLETGEARKGQ